MDDLRLAWVWALDDIVSNQNSPLVHDGVLYIYSPGNRIQALEGDTGELIWEHTIPGRIGPMRGLAIYEDNLIINTPDSHIMALNASTGAEAWSILIAENFINTSGPLVGNGKIFTAFHGARFSRKKMFCQRL